jgi:predicted dehydrogenase
MANKVRWGVLSTAGIGVKKVLPAMQKGAWSEIAAIASRDLGKAKEVAENLKIATAYGSYEELLADPQIEAVYNPLPNQLHVPWTIKAAEAGKHVLCEKPLGMTAAEAETLVAVAKRTGVKIGEAFMVRTHPQWLRARALVQSGRIEIEIPFNAPNDRPCRIFIDDGRDVFGGGITVEEFPTCDQYTLQGDAFSKALRENTEVPVPLGDGIRNMAAIDAVFRSAQSGKWESPQV